MEQDIVPKRSLMLGCKKHTNELIFLVILIFIVVLTAGYLTQVSEKDFSVSKNITKKAGSGSSYVEKTLKSLTPKASLDVIEGVKTQVPNVPPPIVRRENKMVEYELTTIETKGDIAPSVTYESLWTFDGTVPAPVLRVKVGDVIRLTLHNETENERGHNVDFHFVSGPGGGSANTTVFTGESRTIEVRALYPGMFMYHSSFGDVPGRISNGMYGFVIVDPVEPLPVADHEFVLVQSEFYVDEETNDGSFQKIVDENPTHVFFNGKHKDLKEPIKIGNKDRVRLYVGNAGLNLVSSFHVIGAIFDQVYTNGSTLSGPEGFGVQSVVIPAGGATIVEFIAWTGKHLAADHSLSRVFYEGLGELFIVEGEANPEIYEEVDSPVKALTKEESEKKTEEKTEEKEAE